MACCPGGFQQDSSSQAVCSGRGVVNLWRCSAAASSQKPALVPRSRQQWQPFAVSASAPHLRAPLILCCARPHRLRHLPCCSWCGWRRMRGRRWVLASLTSATCPRVAAPNGGCSAYPPQQASCRVELCVCGEASSSACLPATGPEDLLYAPTTTCCCCLQAPSLLPPPACPPCLPFPPCCQHRLLIYTAATYCNACTKLNRSKGNYDPQ